MKKVPKIPIDEVLISFCGFYCGSCSKFLHNQCFGCKGDSPSCAVGCKACRVRACCITNGYSSCADCEKFRSVKDCHKYNPFLIRLGQFLTNTSRRKGIEMIKKNGKKAFAKLMASHQWVTLKN